MATAAPTRASSAAADDRANISRVPYLPGLDGMRALAVVAVMIYHANSDWLSGGFLGVEMFFVISGYLITLLLIAERERTYRISLKQFWIRRARRLLPALFATMGLVTIWTALFKPDALGQLRGDIVAGLFYVSNWYQIWVGLGYTAAADFAPLRHLWSLAVEEQFYIVWPLIMLALLRTTGTRRIASISRWLFLVSIGITAAVAMLYHPGPVGAPEVTPEAYWFVGERPVSKLDTLYLSTPTRAAGLMLGAALAMVWRPLAIARGPLRDRGRVFDGAALLALVLLGVMCWNVYLVTPGGAADAFLFQGGFFVASIATLAIIAAVTHPAAAANRVLGNRPMLWIGTRSYGLYLYHWPIYQIMRGAAGNKLDLVQFTFAMVLTAAIAEVSYRYLEMPIRRGEFKAMLGRVRMSPNAAQRRALAGGLAALLGLSLFAGATLATAELQQNEVAEDLEESENFTTDLTGLNAGAGDPAAPTLPPTLPPTVPPSTVAPVVPVTTLPPATSVVEPLPPPVTTVDPSVATTVDPSVATTAPPVPPETTLPPLTIPPETTVPPVAVPATTLPPPPPATQLGVITDMSTVTPLLIPPTNGGIPLIALGDSVMLGAAEELTERGVTVDAVKSRQLSAFLPDFEAAVEAGIIGSVVIVHLGTNGSFPTESLDRMMSSIADVPVVVFVTGKANRSWIGGNNQKIRELPDRYANVTVVDWEVIGGACGDCFYGDGIHLDASGQRYYTDVLGAVIGF